MRAPWRFLPAVTSYGGKNCRHAIGINGDQIRRIKKDPDQSGPGLLCLKRVGQSGGDQ
jgi:hypothetical protein